MPWPPAQRKAIAADLRRRGKSSEEVSSFFHRHGHGGKKKRKRHQGSLDALVKELRR